MRCLNCGSERVSPVSVTSGNIKNGRGCGWLILHTLLVILTAGIWLIFLLIRGSTTKGKITSTTQFVCLDCGSIVKPEKILQSSKYKSFYGKNESPKFSLTKALLILSTILISVSFIGYLSFM